MAQGEIKGLPGYVWVYPDRPNPYGVQVSTRTAYNPLTGDTLNQRQATALAHGGVQYEERRPEVVKEYKLRELGAQGNADVRDFIAQKAKQGITMTEREARQSAEYKQIVRALNYTSNKPNSAKAKALVALGRRESEWDWLVGETPTEGEEAA